MNGNKIVCIHEIKNNYLFSLKMCVYVTENKMLKAASEVIIIALVTLAVIECNSNIFLKNVSIFYTKREKGELI